MKVTKSKSTKSRTKKTVKPVASPKTVTAKPTTRTAKAKPAKSAKAAKIVTAPIPQITTETIAARAYNLWEKDGRPNGRDTEYWFQAENQLKQESQSFAA